MHVVPPAAGSTPVTLSAAAAAAIRAATVAALPQEACGLLFGTGRHVAEATTARNIAADPVARFEIDPVHLFDAHRRAREGPLALLGCWHSHPNGSPRPSALDFDAVADPAWLWLVATPATLAVFRPTPQGFQQLALEMSGL
jgi:proteasome lid subunit RPN8/RPN11